MSILVSPAEPAMIKTLGPSSAVCESYGADILVSAPFGLIGVQRKEFPGDFLGSLYDGRLTRLVMKMRALPMRIMVLEGIPIWTTDGKLIGSRAGNTSRYELSRRQFTGLLLTLQYEAGISCHWTEDQADTVRFVGMLNEWAGKAKHQSLDRRPGPSGMEVSGRDGPSSRDWQRFVLQGIEGIGPTVAADIVDHFDGLPLQWSVSADELGKVRGLGPGRVAKLTEFIPAKEEST